jgi:hypothetical protein
MASCVIGSEGWSPSGSGIATMYMSSELCHLGEKRYPGFPQEACGAPCERTQQAGGCELQRCRGCALCVSQNNTATEGHRRSEKARSVRTWTCVQTQCPQSHPPNSSFPHSIEVDLLAEKPCYFFNSAPSCTGKSPDWLYCRDLLQQYGIVVVPGSGFGQADGTFHFRTTFLPSETDIGLVVDNLTNFHARFLMQYGSANGTHHLVNGCSNTS